MEPAEVAGIIGSFAALVAAAGWIANLSLNQIQRRKLLAETGKAELELDDAKGEFNAKTLFATAGDMIENLRKEVARLAVRLAETEARLERVEKELEETQASERRYKLDLEAAQARIARMEELRGRA